MIFGKADLDCSGMFCDVVFDLFEARGVRKCSGRRFSSVRKFSARRILNVWEWSGLLGDVICECSEICSNV